jgi:hypothetical protein
LQPSQPESADDIFEAEERDERVRKAMLDLPEEQAVLVRQAFFLGRSHSSDRRGYRPAAGDREIAHPAGLLPGLRRTLESGDGGEMTLH